MSIVSYSSCRIQFNPNDQRADRREYSGRSLVELRQFDLGGYSVRAVDVEKKNEEIFNIPLRQASQYRRGQSGDQPDEVPSKSGTYSLWLSEASRTGFHKELAEIFAELASSSRSSSKNGDRHQNENQNNFADRDASDENHDTPLTSASDLLVNVGHLNKRIEQGDANETARLATQLASSGVHLQVKPPKNSTDENEFIIQVQLDGNDYGTGQHGPTIPVKVFPSTTVRELRAAFELSRQYLPTSQYFFADGSLLHDDQAMSDLNVGPNSLFVLFLLTHVKAFPGNAPWKCPSCKGDNSAITARCVTCAAARTC